MGLQPDPYPTRPTRTPVHENLLKHRIINPKWTVQQKPAAACRPFVFAFPSMRVSFCTPCLILSGSSDYTTCRATQVGLSWPCSTPHTPCTCADLWLSPSVFVLPLYHSQIQLSQCKLLYIHSVLSLNPLSPVFACSHF